MLCSEFQQLKLLQSSLPALAQSEAEACKSLIDAFTTWFAANHASHKGGAEDAFQVRCSCFISGYYMPNDYHI